MSEPFDITKYRRGYSMGVGGVVLCGAKVLLVRSAFGKHEWTIPGGYVEAGETIDIAVQREIMEETGVRAELQGLIGVRNRINPDDNSAYLIFLLQSQTEATQPDGVEVDDARYFTFSEVQSLSTLNTLSRIVVIHALEQKIHMLTFHPHPTLAPSEYVLYL